MHPFGEDFPVAAFVPDHLRAVCRILHRFVGGPVDRRWAEVAADLGFADRAALAELVIDDMYGRDTLPDSVSQPEVGNLDERSFRTLADVLGDPSDPVFVAVWPGGTIRPEDLPGAMLPPTQWRGHLLCEATLRDVVALHRGSQVGAIWWPPDRSWLVHTPRSTTTGRSWRGQSR